jgi:predicted TIM-barrel fold metal-dependent hydrolase
MPFLTPPPDPSPKTPKINIPKGAWDCHFHLFGPTHLYPFDPASPYVSDDRLPETFFDLQKTLGFEKGVLISGGGYGRDTKHLVDTLTHHSNRLRGIIWANDDIENQKIAELNQIGVRGIRFISEKRHGGLPVFSKQLSIKVFEQAQWQVHFYPCADLMEYASRLLEIPNPVVLDHFAHLDPREGLDHLNFKTLLKMIDSGKVWVKLSGPMRSSHLSYPYQDINPYAKALIEYAPERMIWGSDWPHVNMRNQFMPNDGDLVDLLGTWTRNSQQVEQILVKNPTQLFDT